MILARTSLFVVIVLSGCVLAFHVAGMIAVYNSIKLANEVRKYWAKKGVKLGFLWWSPDRYLINDPEYNKVRDKVTKVNLMCVVIIFSATAVFFITSLLRSRG